MRFSSIIQCVCNCSIIETFRSIFGMRNWKNCMQSWSANRFDGQPS